MGKKFDAWNDAFKAKDQSEKNLGVAEGGSTQKHMNETKANVEQARRGEELTYSEFLEDPEG
jgi:hypothetical protein